jgi:Na+/melibiose symporter-like transporter
MAFLVSMIGLIGLSKGMGAFLAALFLGVVIGAAGFSTAKAHDQEGKAFAVIAIVIGLAVLVLLLIALLAYAR